MLPKVSFRCLIGLLVLGSIGCGSNSPSGAKQPTSSDGGSDAAVVDRGPTRLPLDGDPNGLWWDASSQTLYIADDNGNRILKWTDAAGLGAASDLPPASADGPGLGQLVK